MPHASSGYRSSTRSRDVGSAAAFPAVADALLTFGFQRAVGMRIREAPARAEVGATFSARWLGVPVECVITRVWEEPTSAGFTYRTRDGHALEGEETFLVAVEQGRAVVTLNESSRAASGLARLPGARAVQGAINRSYLRFAERTARRAERG